MTTIPTIQTADGDILYPQIGETILETLERYGYYAEYQCRQGYCGHCRLKLQAGKIIYPQIPLAYVPTGEILACCAILKTDIQLNECFVKAMTAVG